MKKGQIYFKICPFFYFIAKIIAKKPKDLNQHFTHLLFTGTSIPDLIIENLTKFFTNLISAIQIKGNATIHQKNILNTTHNANPTL